MSSLRANGLVCLLTAVAASCWDGALDPIFSASDGGDSDTDTDTDMDTDTDTGTEPAACSVSVSVDVYVIWDYDVCDFQYHGLCATDAASCSGCAWVSGVEGDCEEDEVCCIGEDELEHCVTDWELDFYCGYRPGECEAEPDYGEGVEAPVCPGGTFCCFTWDEK